MTTGATRTMSNETEQQQLWTDQRIADEVGLRLSKQNEWKSAIKVATLIRNEYEQRIATLTAELEAAREWQPVPNGYTYSANKFQGRHIERATVADDWLTVAWRPESGDEYKASIQLPDNIRLCRLVEIDEPGVAIPVEAIKRVMSACAATVDHHHPGVRDEIIQALRDVEAMLDEMEPPNVD